MTESFWINKCRQLGADLDETSKELESANNKLQANRLVFQSLHASLVKEQQKNSKLLDILDNIVCLHDVEAPLEIIDDALEDARKLIN